MGLLFIFSDNFFRVLSEKNVSPEFKKIIYTEDERNILRNMLNKIDRLERKIIPRAILLEEFSKSKI